LLPTTIETRPQTIVRRRGRPLGDGGYDQRISAATAARSPHQIRFGELNEDMTGAVSTIAASAQPFSRLMICFRFAPTQNGFLHLGHANSALINFDLARASGGRFLLRIEDIDATRCRPEFEQAIYEDLSWLGIAWEQPVRRQSDTSTLSARTRRSKIRSDLPTFSRAEIACWSPPASAARWHAIPTARRSIPIGVPWMQRARRRVGDPYATSPHAGGDRAPGRCSGMRRFRA
jgi:hypothetical protein